MTVANDYKGWYRMTRWQLRLTYDSSYGDIAYDAVGKGKPLLLIHGAPFSSTVWRNVVPHLSSLRRVYVYDMLGYGLSAKPDDMSLRVQADSLTELMRFWGLEKPIVIAQGMGAAVALCSHLFAKRDYEHLILMAPMCQLGEGTPFQQHLTQHHHAFESLPTHIHAAIVTAYEREAMYQPIADHEIKPLIYPWLGENGQAAFYRQMIQPFSDDLLPLLPQIDLPVRLIWGAHDRWVPVSKAEALQNLFANATLRIIPDAGHLIQEDLPEELSALLVNYIEAR